jgi:hypothetical protein
LHEETKRESDDADFAAASLQARGILPHTARPRARSDDIGLQRLGLDAVTRDTAARERR